MQYLWYEFLNRSHHEETRKANSFKQKRFCLWCVWSQILSKKYSKVILLDITFFFSNWSSIFFSDHLLRHLGIRNYPCNQCTFSFCTPSDMKNHIKKYHGSNKDNKSVTNEVINWLSCNYLECDSKFKFRVNLESHIKFKHLKLRPFVCHCGKSKPWSSIKFY